MTGLHDTGPQRAATRFMRGVYFGFGAIMLPVGVVMLPSSVGVGIMLVVLASLMLAMWWAFHRPLASPIARRWQRVGMALSVAVAVALMVGLIASSRTTPRSRCRRSRSAPPPWRRRCWRCASSSACGCAG